MFWSLEWKYLKRPEKATPSNGADLSETTVRPARVALVHLVDLCEAVHAVALHAACRAEVAP